MNIMKKIKIAFEKVYILIAVAAVLLITTLCIGLVRYKKSTTQRTVNVAFYNLPEKVTKTLEDNIKSAELARVFFKSITLEELNNEKALKNYDVIFTYDGIVAENLKKKGTNISGRLFSMLPSSLKRETEDNSRKAIPVLLDHFELSYNKMIAEKTGLENPQSFNELLDFLEASKKYIFTPFFTNGGDDEILLGLISCLIEAKGGYDAYSDFVKNVRKNPALDKIISLKLGEAGSVTLEEILELFRNWQENGIVHPNWYNAKFRDIIAFMEDGQISVLFTKLSVHRTIPYKLIRDFSTERAPVASAASATSASVDHAVIAPAIYAIKLSKKSINDKVLHHLLTEETQSALSMGTQLGPVALRGESFDVQADDVRFFAASCRYGSRAGIYLDCFASESEASKKLCEGIRRYLNTGRL